MRHQNYMEQISIKLMSLESRSWFVSSIVEITKQPTHDTAVELSDLPAYIADFSAMMERHGQSAIYYAHAGAGELHLRPVLNLKQQKAYINLKI
jgi:FAD/FMN-containing dehydrogenase